MDLDLSFITGNSESTDRNTTERTESHAEPPQWANPSNYTPTAQNAVQRTLDPLENKLLIEQAEKIVKDYRQKREAAAGIMKQIEQDIGKQDPMLLLLFAAEALDRLSGGGDSYIKRLEAKAKAAGVNIQPYKF